MISECFVFGMAYWLLAVIGFIACVPAITYGYFKMYKTTEAPFAIGCVAITLAICGFCGLVFGIAPYLPCIKVVMLV